MNEPGATAARTAPGGTEPADTGSPPPHLVWVPNTERLPERVLRTARRARAAKRLYYPYWRLEFEVTVRAWGLGARIRRAEVAVDGLTGTPCVVVAARGLPEAGAGRPGVPAGTVPFALAADEVDHDRVEQILWPLVSKRLRSWTNVAVSLSAVEPAYKQLLLYEVTFLSGSAATLALDTISGEYGIVRG